MDFIGEKIQACVDPPSIIRRRPHPPPPARLDLVVILYLRKYTFYWIVLVLILYLLQYSYLLIYSLKPLPNIFEPPLAPAPAHMYIYRVYIYIYTFA